MRKNSARFKQIYFSLCLLFTSVAFGSLRSDKTYPFLKGQRTHIKNPFQLRDPFRRTKLKSSRAKNKHKKEGVFSNIPNIETVPLANIRIVGVLLGRDRRAVAKTMKGNTLSAESFVLREGMTLGENRAEVKAILPGGVVLVEKFKNVYDQDEYLETILPVAPEN